MGTVERTGAQVELEVDLTTGAVAVDGGWIELPPKEFALLAHLAAHPGKAISRAELIEAIWPETPMMTDQDLYWYVNRLRKNIGDNKREAKVIANRRNFGYFLDLPGSRVKITGSASGVTPVPEVVPSEPETMPEPEPTTIILDEQPVPLVGLEEGPPLTEVPLTRPAAPRRTLRLGRRTTAVLAGILIMGLVATAWSATRNIAPTPDAPGEVADAPERSRENEGRERDKARKGSDQRRRQDDPPQTASSGNEVVATPANAGEASTGREASTSEGTRTEPAKTEQLPPPPTRFLYHLVNQETGDHFVTTDPAESSEREAAGYVGGAIARVYSEKQPGTKAISTNDGRAYVLIDADAETSPSTDLTPLWFVSNDAGDFFYVTSRAEIPRDGWTASLTGYVGAQ